MNEEVQKLKDIISAQQDLINWYEEDHGRWEYEDEDVPRDVLDFEQKLEAAKKSCQNIL